MAVLFDLDETILGTSEKRIEILNRCAKEVGAPEIKRSEYFKIFDRLIQRGRIDTRRPIFEELLHDKDLAEKLTKRYQSLSIEKTFFYPDAKEVLQNLPGKKGLVTNGPRLVQREKIEKFDLSKYFDVIVISGEVGVAKPDPRIFHCALSSIGSSPAESFYVGDVEKLDIIGAKNAGLTSILIRRDGAPPKVKPDYEIRDMRELYELVQE
jgi:putative hydrolase of the HAD superfamily